MRPFCLLLLLLLPAYGGMAQPASIQYSTPFQEPEEGWNKLIQLSNGHTFFFHFTRKQGIAVKVYGADRQMMATATVTSKDWDAGKMNQAQVEGLYEINGQPVLFFHQVVSRVPRLFRIRFNAHTGAVEEEQLIAEMAPYPTGAAWAIAYGFEQRKDFIVEKDPDSDHYAVTCFNTFMEKTDSKIEVIHFTVNQGKHEIASRASYDLQGFKYHRFIGMTVDGANNVFVCVYGYNSRSKGGSGDSRIIVSRMKAGEQTFVHKQLEFSDDFKQTTAIMQYNRGTNLIQLLTLTYLDTKSKLLSNKRTNYYQILLSLIDPETLFILSSRPVVAEKVMEFAQRNFEDIKGFSGLPQQMLINRDFSTTILLEDINVHKVYNTNGQLVSAKTILGDIGVVALDNRGIEEDGYALNKLQAASGEMEAMYLSKKSKGLWSFRSGGFSGMHNNAFLSFDYIDAVAGRFVLFNDYPENDGMDGKKKRKIVTTISTTNTICYTLNNGFVKKEYLFGVPAKNESRFCYVEASHFLKEKNTYATLMISRKGKAKEAFVAWVQFE